jgi:type I restriction enzyme S subunit
VGDAEKLKIPVPPIAIQRKIGDILSKYDQQIINNNRRIQLLEESARLLYKEWFVHLASPATNTSRSKMAYLTVGKTINTEFN